MNPFQHMVALVIISCLCGTASDTARAQNDVMPPSWRSGPKRPPKASPESGDLRDDRFRPESTPWYQPQFAFGVGLNLPEILPLEGYLFFGKYFALRAFYTPPMPFNIRIEMPSDVISTKKGIGVANPDFTIRLKATYGAHYGIEALGFPFGGSFFVMAGASHRRMRLVGGAKSPILVCSLIEASKEPPCGDPNASIQTRTELEIKADIETEALLTRAGLGWFWHIGSSGYFMFNAGGTRPSRIQRKVDVEANLDTPATSDEDITGALAQVKAEREADLEDKAVREMRPVDEKILPILGIAAGIRL